MRVSLRAPVVATCRRALVPALADVGETSNVCPGLLGFPPIHYVIDMCDRIYDPRSYDRPIAVLTGPGAESAGDQVALRMTYHPRTLVFGKTTNIAFDSPEDCPLDLSEPGWSIRYSCAETYRIDAPHDYLTHDDFAVDQPV